MAQTAVQIIDALGGTSAVASAHDLTPSTVSSWRTADFIPRWWQRPLLDMPKAKEIGLTEQDFPPKKPRKVAEQPAQAAA